LLCTIGLSAEFSLSPDRLKRRSNQSERFKVCALRAIH